MDSRTARLACRPVGSVARSLPRRSPSRPDRARSRVVRDLPSRRRVGHTFSDDEDLRRGCRDVPSPTTTPFAGHGRRGVSGAAILVRSTPNPWRGGWGPAPSTPRDAERGNAPPRIPVVLEGVPPPRDGPPFTGR